MEESKNVSLMVTLPKSVRDELRKLAAKENLINLNKVTSAAQLASRIICAAIEADCESIRSGKAEK